MNTKEDFHRLIDTIEDGKTLKGYYQLIQRLNSNQCGELWNSLTIIEGMSFCFPMTKVLFRIVF